MPNLRLKSGSSARFPMRKRAKAIKEPEEELNELRRQDGFGRFAKLEVNADLSELRGLDSVGIAAVRGEIHAALLDPLVRLFGRGENRFSKITIEHIGKYSEDEDGKDQRKSGGLGAAAGGGSVEGLGQDEEVEARETG